jgi:hypothetical protein
MGPACKLSLAREIVYGHGDLADGGGGYRILVFGIILLGGADLELRGTASGMFNLVTGAALAIANVLAGVLWGRSPAETSHEF